MIRFELKGLDELIRKTQKVSALVDRAANSALSSIGYRLKQEAKTAVQGNSLGWQSLSYPTLILRSARPNPNYVPMSRAQRKFMRTMGVKDTNSYLKFSRSRNQAGSKAWGMIGNLPAYKVAKGQGYVEFGFMAGTFGKKASGGKNIIGNSIRDIALKLTLGSEITVTEDMQRFLAGLGFFRRIGSRMKIPGRPLIVPVFERARGNIPGWFTDKFLERFQSYVKEQLPELAGGGS